MTRIERWIKLSRYWLGALMINLAVRYVLPPGRVRRELHAMLDQWTEHVINSVTTHQAG